MFNADKVIKALKGRVGWRQPTQPDYAILTEVNLTTKSKRRFQDFHSAVTIQNIKDLTEDQDISDDDFNLALEGMQESAILRTMGEVFCGSEVVDTVQAFDRQRDIAHTPITNSGKFVGVRVNIARNTDYVTALSNIALLFDSDVEFELKCFIDNNDQAIWTKLVTAKKDAVTIVPVDDLFMSYLGEGTNTTVFYIGYFQENLGEAKAYTEPVWGWKYGYLWRVDYFESLKKDTKFVTPVTYTSNTYGLNPQFTSMMDHTNVIIANASMFDEAIGLQVACDTLELITTSTRTNATERVTKEQLGDLYLALNQDQSTSERPYGPGLKARYHKEVSKLNKAFLGQPRIETNTTSYATYQGQQCWD
jgi:hypothetical protein